MGKVLAVDRATAFLGDPAVKSFESALCQSGERGDESSCYVSMPVFRDDKKGACFNVTFFNLFGHQYEDETVCVKSLSKALDKYTGRK